jgi:hypothetical protein
VPRADLAVPAELGWLADVVAPSWPAGDEAALRRCGQAWRAAADELRGALPDADRAAGRALAALDGSLAEVVRTTWDRFTVGDEAHLEVLAAVCAELADWCDGSAQAIEHAKHQLVGLLVELAFQIAVLIALVPGTFGGSLALIQAAEAATRVRAREVADAATNAVILASRHGTGERVTGLLDALRQRGSTGAPDIGVPPASPSPPLDLGGGRHGDRLPNSGPLLGPPPDPVPTRPDPDATAPVLSVLTGSPSGNPPSGGPSLPPDGGVPPAPSVPVPSVPVPSVPATQQLGQVQIP